MYKGSAKVVVVVDDDDSAFPLSESEPKEMKEIENQEIEKKLNLIKSKLTCNIYSQIWQKHKHAWLLMSISIL